MMFILRVADAACVVVLPVLAVSSASGQDQQPREEQLGLKLEATRGQVEMLVIDRIERPTEN